MRALIIETGRTISPFAEAPPLAHFAGSTVGAAVREALRRRGIDVVEVGCGAPVPSRDASATSGSDGMTLVLADHTFVSDKCLGDFLDAALDVVRGDVSARLALARTPAVDFLRPVSSAAIEPFDDSGPGGRPAKPWRAEGLASERVAFDCFLAERLPVAADGNALLQLLREASVRVVVKKRELGIPLRLPTLGSAQETKAVVPVTSTVAAHIEHWTHILWLNQMAFGVRWMDIARQHKAWCALRLLAAFPFTPFARVMKAFVWKGRGVRIHPTAHVEASILGDGVVIGARASVRNSILGAGVEVGDHGTVLSSSLGDRCFVTPRTFVVWSAAYPDAVLTNYKLQVSLVGRAASLSTWAGLIDAKLQGTIDVKHEGRITSTERSFLGSCIGHGAFVGAKVLIMPGREVPNGVFIAMRPDELLVDVPRDLPAGVPLVRHEGTLVPLERLASGPAKAG